MLLWPPPCYISGVKPLAPTLLVPFALALATSLAACGSAPPRDQPGIVALPGGAHAAFAHYGTNPTVDTAEEALSRVGLGADHASMAIVRHYLGQGVMPPPEAVRVEDIVAASLAPMIVGQPGSARPSIGIEVALVPSPFRKGWHALVVAVTPAARVPEAPPVVVSSTPHDPLALALVARGARLEVGGIPALRRLLDPASRARLVLIDDAAGLGGVEAQGPLLAEVARWREGGGVLSVVERLGPGTDDALLDRLAQDGGGLHEVVLAEDLADSARLATLAARLSAPIGLRAATAELAFDPDKVTRWRLVGSESRVTRAAGRAIGAMVPAGETVFLYYEVKVVAAGALGEVVVRAHDGSASARLEAPAGKAHAARALAVVAAAAFAEKLRGSFWVKDVGWEAIATEVARWVPGLAPWVARARALDRSALEPGAEAPIRATRLIPGAGRP